MPMKSLPKIWHRGNKNIGNQALLRNSSGASAVRKRRHNGKGFCRRENYCAAKGKNPPLGFAYGKRFFGISAAEAGIYGYLRSENIQLCRNRKKNNHNNHICQKPLSVFQICTHRGKIYCSVRNIPFRKAAGGDRKLP